MSDGADQSGAARVQRTRKARPAGDQSSRGQRADAVRGRNGRASGATGRTIPPPPIHSDPSDLVRVGFVRQIRSAFERDPRSGWIALGQALIAIVGWVTFFLVTFYLAVQAYDVLRTEAKMDFGWLSEEELRTRSANDDVLKIPNQPAPDPGGRERGTGPEAETNEGTDNGAGEAEATPVAPRDLGIRLSDRRNWALNVDAAGGNNKKRAAISRGLAWLGRQQHRDGHWQFTDDALYPDGGWNDMETHTGATALALLAYLGAGNTPDGGDHSERVENGLKWLIRQQRSADQERAGDLFDHEDLGRKPHYFAHSVATIALCEAYALTGDETYGEPAREAVEFLLESQHPTKGGWGYMPLNDATSEAYMWVTGWGVMALFTARSAGIEVDEVAFQRASRFIDSVMAAGGASYKNRPSDDPSPSLAGEGMLARQYLGWERSHPGLRDGIEKITAETRRPQWKPGRRNLYGWYHEAQVLHNLGGEDWEAWYDHVQSLIIENQAAGPRSPGRDTNGSWDPYPPGPQFDVMDARFGRLYSTALSLLILETPFRHMPVYPPGE